MCIDLSLLRLTRTSFKWCSGDWSGLSPSATTVGLRPIILHSDAGNSILTFSSLLASVSLVCPHAQQASHWLIFGVDIVCYLHTTHSQRNPKLPASYIPVFFALLLPTLQGPSHPASWWFWLWSLYHFHPGQTPSLLQKLFVYAVPFLLAGKP